MEAVALEIERTVGAEAHALALEQPALQAGRKVGQPVGRASAAGVHHPLPGNAVRRAVQRPADGARRQTLLEQRRQLTVGHHPTPRDPANELVDFVPGGRPRSVQIAVDPALAVAPLSRSGGGRHRSEYIACLDYPAIFGLCVD